MNVERETLVKFGVPITTTVVFAALVLAVGAMYKASPSGKTGVNLNETGALALVALMVAFVVGLAILGAVVARRQHDDED